MKSPEEYRPTGGVRYGNPLTRLRCARSNGSTVKAARRQRHHPLQRQVMLRSAEASVQRRRAAVGEDDPGAQRHVAHPVGASQRAVHPVHRGRLRGPHVGADVIDGVDAHPQQLPVGGKRAFDLGRRPVEVCDAARCSTRSSVQRTGTPKLARSQADQGHVHEHPGLDAEAAAAVLRRDQPQPGSRQAQRRGGDAVKRERPLEVGPCRQPTGLPGPSRRRRRRFRSAAPSRRGTRTSRRQSDPRA